MARTRKWTLLVIRKTFFYLHKKCSTFFVYLNIISNLKILLGVPRGLINQANSCWVNSILQTALVCDPLYHLLCKLLKYTSNSNGESQNTKEIARIGAEIKRMLPTCAKLAEVFDQIVVNKVREFDFSNTKLYQNFDYFNFLKIFNRKSKKLFRVAWLTKQRIFTGTFQL